MKNNIQNWLFRKIHGNNLVYNTCWEDPRCDKELMEIDEQSEIVMITSAGCNALSYLLENPQRVHCIDMNPKQNALLELKKAFFRLDAYEELFACFGDGQMRQMKTYYQSELRQLLPTYAQEYWDKHLHYFNGKGLRKSFYFRGTSGLLAWFCGRYLKLRKKLHRSVEDFFESVSLEQQSQLYQQIDQQLFSSRFLVWAMNRHVVMSLAGVPKSQQQLFIDKYEDGTHGFVKDCMNHVFTTLPASENYFWQLYFQGYYTKDCCPEYLERDNYSSLQQNIDRVQTYTTTITEFLKQHPKAYSHFVLLDHQDWLAENDREALREEWEIILKNSRKGSKILLRSAAEEIDFFPDFVLERVKFEKEKTQLVHQKDRVGTYASTYFGIVQ
ncbi:MAG: BtaA family protein [Bacteroidota bacterium]